MISKELLKEILLEQQKRIEDAKKENFVPREKLEEIKRFIKIKSNLIITGVRRSGKSVFLSQVIHRFFEKYYYVSFEDERLAGFELKDFNVLYETCLELFGGSKAFFLDEVQNIQGWERWVRRMYDNDFKFFITGSNARLLSRELATLLTGRHLQFIIFPFSFKEYLRFHNVGFEKQDVYFTERRAVILKHFSNYLREGGFPEYIKYKRIEILQEYFNDIVQRDIVERYNIKNIRQLKELARFLMMNTANLMSFNQLKRLIKIRSVNTVINYFEYLENSYLLFRVPYFSYSLRKQTANPFKVYAIDIALRDALSFKFSKDFGRIYETIVGIELRRRNKEICYWKNVQREEVDFVIRKGKVEQLIQVCYDVNDVNVKKREISALIKASKELKCKDLLIITEDYEATERLTGIKISFKPLWKWLLES